GIQMAGHSRLEQIRAEMAGGGQLTGGQQQGSIESGNAPSNATDDAAAQRMRELRGEA
ncbi:MAG: PspA/IM30 family protein, partial [Corynebacterium sp.]|nr:PspA/IM30 family protein [Corynebacterium sp.]